MSKTISKDEKIEQRLNLVRKCIAYGWTNTEIIDFCRRSPFFQEGVAKASGRTRKKYLSRVVIRTDYLYKVRDELRNTRYDATQEVAAAMDRLYRAIAMAFEQGDPRAVAGIQKVINRMLGLRVEPSEGGVDPEGIRKQLAAMDLSVGAADKEPEE